MGAASQIENVGVKPTVSVAAAPHDAVGGRDAQLDAAIAKAIELVVARDEQLLAAAEEREHAAAIAASLHARKHWSQA